MPWGDITTSGNSLYLTVFNWPQNGHLYLPGLESEIKEINILENNTKTSLNFTKKNDWTILDIPFKPADPLASVIEVVLKDSVDKVSVKTNLGVYPNSETIYLSEFSEVSNVELKGIRWMEKFGEWKHVNQVSNWKDNSTVTWKVNVQKPGYYYLDLSYKGSGRLVWKMETDEGVKVQNQQAATEKYVFYNMGIVEFKTAGNHSIGVSLVEGDPKKSSLTAMKLRPIE